MKLIYTLLFLFPTLVYSQSLTANYNITKTIELKLAAGNKNITLEMNGFLYRQGNRYIYWEQPAYLKKYPNGSIDISIDNRIFSYALNTDSVQNLFYTDYDHHILRSGAMNPGDLVNEFEFEDGYGENWEFKPETKLVNGLKCQLALDRDQWRVWFCPDIPARSGVFNVKGLPGLIVEADWLPMKAHYQLSSYDTQTTINDEIFAPKQFNETIIKGGRLKSFKPVNEKTKTEKRIELLKQNN
nr:GLPGLI family protein [Pedobacter sp. ASV19]